MRSRRRHSYRRLHAVVVGVALMGTAVTSLAVVVGSRGQTHYAGAERDPLRERIQAELRSAEHVIGTLRAALLRAGAEEGERTACMSERHREANQLLETLRLDVMAFESATHSADTITRLSAADRARADAARLSAAVSAAADCQ